MTTATNETAIEVAELITEGLVSIRKNATTNQHDVFYLDKHVGSRPTRQRAMDFASGYAEAHSLIPAIIEQTEDEVIAQMDAMLMAKMRCNPACLLAAYNKIIAEIEELDEPAPQIKLPDAWKRAFEN